MSMLLKVICGTMFLLGMSWNIMAKGVIKGRVVDSQSKEVLVGATVNVEGTTVGCATDAEGYFELEVEESGTVILVFRSVGYSEVKKVLLWMIKRWIWGQWECCRNILIWQMWW